MLCAIQKDVPQGHKIPRRLHDLQELVQTKPTLEKVGDVRDWLVKIETQGYDLYCIVNLFNKGHHLDEVSLALVTQSQFMRDSLPSMDLHALTMKIYGVPRFLEILTEFLTACVQPNYISKNRWQNQLDIYTQDRDSVWLMKAIARWINQFSRFKPFICNFTDTCPPTFVGTITSKDGVDGKQDWSRAVWCVYSQLQKRGCHLPLDAYLMIHIEEWLTTPHRTPFPHVVRELITFYNTIHVNGDLQREWEQQVNAYQQTRDCTSLMTYVARTVSMLNINAVGAVTCPYANIILSPDGKTDWTVALWLMKVHLQERHNWQLNFKFVFDVDVLTRMEVWLATEYFLVHPDTPAPPVSGLLHGFQLL
jgi:hypothetical protein